MKANDNESKRSASTKDEAPISISLDALSPEEAMTVMRHLLDRHPKLRPEANRFATELIASPSAESVAKETFTRVTSVPLEDFQGRAGKQPWGYVQPSEAAVELLEESLEDLIEDMKRRTKLGLLSAAATVCAGIVMGL